MALPENSYRLISLSSLTDTFPSTISQQIPSPFAYSTNTDGSHDNHRSSSTTAPMSSPRNHHHYHSASNNVFSHCQADNEVNSTNTYYASTTSSYPPTSSTATSFHLPSVTGDGSCANTPSAAATTTDSGSQSVDDSAFNFLLKGNAVLPMGGNNTAPSAMHHHSSQAIHGAQTPMGMQGSNIYSQNTYSLSSTQHTVMGIEGNANHTNTGSTPLHAGGDGGNAAAAVAGAAVVNQFTSTAMHLSSLPEYGAAASGTGEADSGSTTSRFVTSPQIATSVATDVDNIGTSPVTPLPPSTHNQALDLNNAYSMTSLTKSASIGSAAGITSAGSYYRTNPGISAITSPIGGQPSDYQQQQQQQQQQQHVGAYHTGFASAMAGVGYPAANAVATAYYTTQPGATSGVPVASASTATPYAYVRSPTAAAGTAPYPYYPHSTVSARYIPYNTYPAVRHFVSPARPFKCPTCDQSFSRNHDLKRHVKIHSGIKPHKCQKCGKSFGRSDALKRHSMVKRCRSNSAMAATNGPSTPPSTAKADNASAEASNSVLPSPEAAKSASLSPLSSPSKAAGQQQPTSSSFSVPSMIMTSVPSSELAPISALDTFDSSGGGNGAHHHHQQQFGRLALQFQQHQQQSGQLGSATLPADSVNCVNSGFSINMDRLLQRNAVVNHSTVSSNNNNATQPTVAAQGLHSGLRYHHPHHIQVSGTTATTIAASATANNTNNNGVNLQTILSNRTNTF